uniref:Ankyrin repeat domain-containing protein n=1 Tax=Chlamydomonas euryale TaxID=1486919 RepID=A0A7R9VBX9_9CHLO|mmetsp:Transcript_3076/g.8430  ORF Transcript_3076/g.8430 Transcript_3076/m.8430 type:complete len:424 (+) Transcript_3076:106-1377(+)
MGNRKLCHVRTRARVCLRACVKHWPFRACTSYGCHPLPDRVCVSLQDIQFKMPQCASVGTKMAAAAEAADPAAAMSAVAACRASVTLSFAVGRRHFMRAPLLPLLLLVLMSASTGLRQVAARRAARSGSPTPLQPSPPRPPQIASELLAKLISAAYDGRLLDVEDLLSEGADVNGQTEDGRSPLMSAVGEGHLDVVWLLLRSGADTEVRDSDEYTPLILAAERGHIDMARLLLISGAQRDAVDKGGRTAIDVAMLSSHPDIAEMIALYNPSTFIVRDFISVNGSGLLVAENLTSVVQVEFPVGSYMAGASISRTGPGVPAMAVISTSAPTPNNTHATWIMACCHGQDIKMVELQVTMQPDGVYVLATGAGYYRTACNLNADIVNSAWVAKNSMAVSTCFACRDYGVSMLVTSLAPGSGANVTR